MHEVTITGLTRIAEPTANRTGNSILAFFDCETGGFSLHRCAFVRTARHGLTVWPPKLDGFEVVELAGSKPHYVFATAYDQFALRAFEVHAIDYLLKPFSRERLAQALAHARSRAPQPARIEAVVAEAARRHAPLERILIRDGARVHVVPAAEIDYIEAQDDYVQIAAGGKTWLKNQRLSELESQLEPGAFLRIHRSYIVKVGAIARIEAVSKDSHCAVLHSGARLPISRGSYAKVRERLG